MNREKLNSYVALYKQHFDKISDDEVYKWKAVKRFNENWDINAIDFPDMLERTFDFKGNLLVSKNFLPLDTIKVAVNINSVMVREMFNYLYDENILLSDRIIFFRNGIEQILGLKGQNLNDYHGDGRAIMVYLSFKYPDKYYLYKYEMFNEFCAAIDYEGKPGLREDLLTKIHKYTILCNTVKHELERDTELLLLHNRRLNKINCTDPENNLLTQDFIYAVQYHFKNVPLALTEFVGENVVVYLQNTYLLKENAVNLNARIVDFDKRNRNISRIGRKGEEFVLETEKNILKRDGINKIPEHTSVIKGDGIGYDILSYRKVENKITPIKIEVKTTTGSFYNDFYITANELEASKLDSDRYYLYRVYDFNEEIMSGNIHIEKGSLEKLTNNPINYKVILSLKEMTIKDAQTEVDNWIKTYGVRYFNELTNMAMLTEEVGEVARIIARKYGEQSFKESDKEKDLGDEMADVLWVLICLANQTGVDLEAAFKKNMEKKTNRDSDRHLNNEKLQ